MQLGGVNLDVEEALLATLPVFGEPAKTFLLQRLTHMPVSKENLNAAIALAFFPPSDAVAKTALSLLSQDACLFDETFAPYLVCLAEGLQSEADRIAFKKLPFPKDLRGLFSLQGALMRLKGRTVCLLKRIWLALGIPSR